MIDSELPFVLRYLGRFPSESQVQFITKQMEEDPNSTTLSYDKVEAYLLEVLQKNEFMPASYEDLMNCFRKLDPKNRGFIKVSTFKDRVLQSQ